MALKATIYKAGIQISDMDRHYYETHALTLARHPSETDERLMLRLLAFGMYADERLSFTRGLSSTDEPELWRKSLSDEIELWIELGQPDERRIRKACGQADQVVVLSYGGSAPIWWEKISPELSRFDNLSVLSVPPTASQALAAWADRQLELQLMIEDGTIWATKAGETLEIQPIRWRESGSD